MPRSWSYLKGSTAVVQSQHQNVDVRAAFGPRLDGPVARQSDPGRAPRVRPAHNQPHATGALRSRNLQVGRLES